MDTATVIDLYLADLTVEELGTCLAVPQKNFK